MTEKGKNMPPLMQCPRCHGERWKQEELSMSGKYPFLSKAWGFQAFICQECGYTELYHKRTSS